MINLLTIQSNICESSKDARGGGGALDQSYHSGGPNILEWEHTGVSIFKKSSGMMFLPSENLLQKYKNCIEQTPGLNENMFILMFNESNV